MSRYIIRRILSAIPLVFVITVIVFTLIQLAPFNAVDTLVKPTMSPAVVAQIKASHGLDKPPYIQYFYWVKNIFQGDWGNSIVTNSSISDSLLTRIPNTMALVIPSFLVAFLMAVILGLVAGAKKGKFADKLIDGFCTLAISIPTFWFALLLMVLFGSIIKILPVTGMYSTGDVQTFGDYLRHLILPLITLVIGISPEMIRYVRSSTIGQLNEDYVVVQKAYGSKRSTILVKHVFKNILIPIVTLFGTLLPMLVTGAFITERIFSWPGVGPYFLTAINGLDYPVIMAVLLLSSTLVILGNLIADILYCVIDPRIKEMKS